MTNLIGASPAGPDAAFDHERFFERTPAMLAVVGLDGCFKLVNPAFERRLGRAADELVDQPYLDLVHPDDRVATTAEAAALAAGIDSATFENRFRDEHGEYHWLAWTASADLDRELLYYVAEDVTEAHAQRAVIDRLVTELQRSNADLGQFAYVASHDLSEPLRMVSSYVQLLADRYTGQLDADADEFIGYAVDGATRMKALIDDLLAYSRAGRVAPVRRVVDTAAVLRDVVTDLGAVIDDASAIVDVGPLPVVMSDPGLLAQLFRNLLSNALKFVAPDVTPTVAVTAEHIGAEWQFAVRDNGIGIADQHKERVFMMFKRLHGRAEYPGTGIGLALCQQIVERLDGRIWLDSEPGQGSTFHVAIPAVGSA